MNDFDEKIDKYIRRHALLAPGDRVLVALSGGADSVALLRVLSALGYRCVAAHCNFHLRGAESDRDEAFVGRLCSAMEVECLTVDFDVEAFKRSHGVSTEMACRDLRYEWFARMLEAHGCQALAVAHHRDDNVETLLLNLLRGTGITGLVGIKPRNGNVVRPLLGVGREDILTYLEWLGQDYVTDSTNLDSDYSRNKIRNILLPELRRLFPSGQAGIERTLDNLAGDYEVWRQAVERFEAVAVVRSDGDITIDRRRLADSPDALTMLRHAVGGCGFSGDQLRQMLATDRVGATFETDGYMAEVGREELTVMPKTIDCGSDDYALADAERLEREHGIVVETVDNDGSIRFERGGDAAYFDADAIGSRLTVRHWRQGDRFRPFGMKGTKKLSDYFNDHKFSLRQKRRALIVEARGRIVWLVGERAADEFRVGDATRRILVMRMKAKEW